MHELTGLKSNSATNYIQDKDGNIIKIAYSATTIFNEKCSIHKVVKDPTESPSNIHFSRLEYMTQRKLNTQHFSIPYITCDFVYSQLIHLRIEWRSVCVHAIWTRTQICKRHQSHERKQVVNQYLYLHFPTQYM